MKEFKEFGKLKNGSIQKTLLKGIHELTTRRCQSFFPWQEKIQRVCSDLTKKETFNSMMPS